MLMQKKKLYESETKINLTQLTIHIKNNDVYIFPEPNLTSTETLTQGFPFTYS